MREPSPIQTWWACGAVCALALYGLFGFYSMTEPGTQPDADIYKVGDQAARFQELQAALPATATMLGYVSDKPTRETIGAALYSSAQYTFAPRLVTDHAVTPPTEFVIGNFSAPLDVVEFGRAQGLTLVRDFGNGAVLYRRQSR